MAQQRTVLLAALLDEAGHGRQLNAPHFVRSPLLHPDDEEARGAEHVEVEGGLTVVVVLLDGGQEVGAVGAAGGFEVDERELAAGAAAHQQVGAQLHPYPRGGVGGGVGLLGLAPVQQVAAVALAAHLAGQLLQVGPLDAALLGAAVDSRLQHGGVKVGAVGQCHGVELASEAQQLVFEVAQVRVADVRQGAVLGLGQSG